MVKIKLYNWLIPKLLSKNCPNMIPRSGEKGEAVDCFTIAWDEKDRTPFLLVKGFSNNEFTGMKWNGSRYDGSHSISIEEAEQNYKFRAIHYYGLADINYKNIFFAAFNYVTRWLYLIIKIRRFLDKFSGYVFNKRRLITKKRIELLKFLIENYLDSDRSRIDSFSLMSKLYSIRWIDHPEGERVKKKIELYLDALVKEDALIRTNGEYKVQGIALSYLEKYEEEEQRHKDSISLRRRVFWLSVIVALTGIIATGIIKIPTLLDLGSEQEQSEVSDR